jgi:hypothetical protein
MFIVGVRPIKRVINETKTHYLFLDQGAKRLTWDNTQLIVHFCVSLRLA